MLANARKSSMAKKQKKTITDDEVTPPLGTLLEQPAELSTDAGAFDDLPAPLEEEVAAHDAANAAQTALLEQERAERHEALPSTIELPGVPETAAERVAAQDVAKARVFTDEERAQIATHGHVLER